MEQESAPKAVSINGELFDVIKPTRLLPGMVLRSQARSAYARLGPKDSTLEEQIHTVSLFEKGFPVARVLSSGEYSANEWYFVEESLGETTFGDQFSVEYTQNKNVSYDTYNKYLEIIERYALAQYSEKNRSSISPQEFIESTVPDSLVIANYSELGGDIDRYHAALQKAAKAMQGYPMGILQQDLNPQNILEGGVIDFELVGYGPLGYDTLLSSRWHRWFTSDQTAKYHLRSLLTPEQISASDEVIIRQAKAAAMPNPLDLFNEFVLIKTAWGFSGTKTLAEEPESKRDFYRYRAGLLTLCVESYLNDERIDPLTFPEFRA